MSPTTRLAEFFGYKKPTTDPPKPDTQDVRKHTVEKSGKLSSADSSFQTPPSDNPSGTGAERAGPGASVAPGEGSSTMGLPKQNGSIARVALTFADAAQAKSARRIFQNERSAHYLGLPDLHTLVIGEDELSWFLPLLEDSGLGSSFSRESVLQTGDLSTDELAHLKRRQGISPTSHRKIRKLLERAKARQQKLKKERV